MLKKDCYFLGKIVGKHSFKGELIVKLEVSQPEDYLNMESVFVEIDNNLIPFFIEKSSLQRSQLLRVKFEDVDSEMEANELINHGLYLPLEVLPELEDDQFYYHEIVGFVVTDVNFGHIGVLNNVNDQTPQTLFVIDRDGVEILVPFHDEFVEKLDKENKTIKLRLPEGFLEMYI